MTEINDVQVQIMRQEMPQTEAQASKKRVGVYCRVSTDQEDQLSSLQAQMTGFQSLIASRPDWEHSDTFADEGLTGTNTRRPEFLRMLADCEVGKLDYIVTKSISRFARNTVDTLQYVRGLREKGVHVYFERERLDTATIASELILTVLAAVAQEESHSISENQKWAYRKRFQAGIASWTNLYGFRKGKQGKHVVFEEEAMVVRRVFSLYASGSSLPQICRALEQDGIRTARGNKWYPTTISDMLHNERYVGDMAMQKHYTVDHLSHRAIKNDATIVPRYYVKDHHIPIVDRRTFNIVQTILELKDLHRGSSQYPYYGFLRCPLCGERMLRHGLPTRPHTPAWTCGGAEHEERGRAESDRPACPPYTIREHYIDHVVRTAFRELDAAKLREIAEGDGSKGRAARAALEWRSSDPDLKKIEYIFLDALVRKITFRRWSEAVVVWKFGVSSMVEVHYARPSDIPMAELEIPDGRCNGGPAGNGAAMVHCNRKKTSGHNLQVVRKRGLDGRPERPIVYTDRSVAARASV